MIVRRNKIINMELINHIINYYISSDKKDYISIFETEIKKYLNSAYVLLTASGRNAMEIILKYYKFPSGSEIIMPAYTLIDLPIIIEKMGYKPVFVDVMPDSIDMNIQALKNTITKRTVAVIATHLFGIPCNIEEIMTISKEYNLIVIEDGAHSLGATIRDKKVGTFADAGFFSLEVTKPINTFGGGILATPNGELYDFAKRELHVYDDAEKDIKRKICAVVGEEMLIRSPLYNCLAFLFYKKEIRDVIVSLYRKHNKKVNINKKQYTNVQAFIGIKAMKSLDKKNMVLADKIDLMQKYLTENYRSLKINRGNKPSFYMNVMLSDVNVQLLRKKLLWKGIDIGIKDEVTNYCPGYYGLNDKYFVNAKYLYEHIIQFPMSYNFSDKKIIKIAAKINNINI